ncbi:TetR family transcriptional regulator [Streptomyces sp. B-S-A8]|uniref:TetR family transcriptional regulator n=1 Tax=Streptomyces solicavernae TaxID=3043614 RepID=A0ABT6RM60_9ACTN|nr:TetR/AcrR family transcriptional regulator [Streptomyces sp. B-S-A8]MDI3385514.1 TetR family transcriptional regulator [Streptomyces sp. B-S-A8]
MRQNPARRTALLDAAIDVLAQEGSRGLTLRAVDKAAGVPTGTTTNYFANRAELLRQIMGRTKERLTPDPAAMEETMSAEPGRELNATLLRQLVERMRADRSSHLAMLELRLEATRRPELQADLTRTFTELLDDNIAWHLDAGLPGDRDTVLLLYLAMLGVIVDDLTVPALLEPHGIDHIIAVLVERSAPPGA